MITCGGGMTTYADSVNIICNAENNRKFVGVAIGAAVNRREFNYSLSSKRV